MCVTNDYVDTDMYLCIYLCIYLNFLADYWSRLQALASHWLEKLKILHHFFDH
jgi:hypothetical protein